MHDCIAIAAASLKKTGENYTSDTDPQFWTWRLAVSDMCDAYSAAYPGFDRRAFYIACGLNIPAKP